MLGRRLWPVALIAAVLAVAAAGPSMALGASAGQHQRGKARAAQQQQPAINSQTDPAAAAAALNAAGSPSNISWQTGTAPRRLPGRTAGAGDAGAAVALRTGPEQSSPLQDHRWLGAAHGCRERPVQLQREGRGRDGLQCQRHANDDVQSL